MWFRCEMSSSNNITILKGQDYLQIPHINHKNDLVCILK